MAYRWGGSNCVRGVVFYSVLTTYTRPCADRLNQTVTSSWRDAPRRKREGGEGKKRTVIPGEDVGNYVGQAQTIKLLFAQHLVEGKVTSFLLAGAELQLVGKGGKVGTEIIL